MERFFIPANTQINEMRIFEAYCVDKIERVYEPEKHHFFGLFVTKEKRYLKTKYYYGDKKWQTDEEVMSSYYDDNNVYFLNKNHEIWKYGHVAVWLSSGRKLRFIFKTDNEKEEIINSISKLNTFVEITSSGIV